MNALQKALLSTGLATPIQKDVVAKTNPVEETVKKPSGYHYRGLPCTIQPDEKLWCVSGHDTKDGGSGVLEWCHDEYDAIRIYREMKRDTNRFQKLKYHPYLTR